MQQSLEPERRLDPWLCGPCTCRPEKQPTVPPPWELLECHGEVVPPCTSVKAALKDPCHSNFCRPSVDRQPAFWNNHLPVYAAHTIFLLGSRPCFHSYFIALLAACLCVLHQLCSLKPGVWWVLGCHSDWGWSSQVAQLQGQKLCCECKAAWAWARKGRGPAAGPYTVVR